ncbi:MAG TPA: hypothetical protein VK066_14190 [Chloroflexota bacterium]|nr:hypothetical protein [Chloroflexota bacterium]
MRWLLLLGVLLLPNAAQAQTTPPSQVPVDMTAVTLPTVPSGQCLALDPGELTVAVQLVGDGFGAPVSFTFAGYGGADGGATLAFPATYQPTVRRVVLSGGTYCYELQNEGPVPATEADMRLYWQAVTLRLTWTPRGPAPR